MAGEFFLHTTHHWPEAKCEKQSERAGRGCPSCGNVFVIEWRDEVFARLAADLRAQGLRVLRSKARAMAWWRSGRCVNDLLIVNLDQPQHGGWITVAQLRAIRPAGRIWAYVPRVLPGDRMIAERFDMDDLIEYQGDLLRLSEEIRQRTSPSARVCAGHSLDQHHLHVLQRSNVLGGF